MAAATWTMACLLLVANSGPADTFYFNQRDFQIPIGITDPSRRGDIKEVLLFQGTPDGKSWRPIGRTTPEKEWFEFHAPEDAPYLFKMGVISRRTGKQEEGEPRCIIVDTAKPVIEIQSAEHRATTCSCAGQWRRRIPTGPR